MRRRILTALILLLVLAAAVRLVRLRRQQLQRQRPLAVSAVPVSTGRVTRGDFHGRLVCYGELQSDHQAVLRARVGGTVAALPRREGDAAAAGSVLVELDGTADTPRDERAAVAAAVRNLERSVASLTTTVDNLRATLENDRLLHRNGAISADQLAASENRYEEARVRLVSTRSELAAQRTRLGWFTVRAPFRGEVAAVLVSLGDVVAPGQPLVRLQAASPCRVRATVAAADLSRLDTGAPAVLHHAGRTLVAPVGRIHPALAPDGTGRVDILLDTPPFGLPLGATITVDLPADTRRDVLLVPTPAVLAVAGTARVHVVEADTVRIVPVTVLAAGSDTTAVAGDLVPGEALVLGGDSLLLRLADGTRVIRREATP